MSAAPQQLAPGRPEGGAAEAFWWAYEHLPETFDPLIRFGRGHLLPLIRGGVELRRFVGTAGQDSRSTVVIAAGASLTLDYLLAQIFAVPPDVQALGSVSLRRLPRHVEGMIAGCDLVLASVPRAWGARFGPNYLRVPALIGASLRVGRDLETTLAAASRTVRAEARRARDCGYDWTYSRSLADFDRFYDAHYLPFVRSRFHGLGRPRSRHELRREFRRGGMIWLHHRGRPVGGEIVRVTGHSLRAVAEGVDPVWLADRQPGAQAALNLATCELALQRGLSEIDLGGTMPSLRNGVLRNKKAWGARFAPWHDSHRDILIRWALPPSPAITSFLGRVAPVFATSSGLAALAAGEHVAPAAPWRHLRVPGVDQLFVLGMGDGDRADAAGCVPLAADVDAATVNAWPAPAERQRDHRR